MSTNNRITHAEVRMYRMGTGDCFAIKFLAGDTVTLKMMIDAGTWQGSSERLAPYIEDLKTYFDSAVDVMVVTHEHKDHVHAFDACEELFLDNFTVGQIWMGWTENEKSAVVRKWKKEYGDKKRALGAAARKVQEVITSDDFKKQFAGARHANVMLGAREHFSSVVTGFADLHLSAREDGTYVGGLKGMEVVKNKIARDNIRYFNPGDIITDLEGAEGLRFYFLGPPRLWNAVQTENGGAGETYDHNKELAESEAFGAAIENMGNQKVQNSLLPFEEPYVLKERHAIHQKYESKDWRKIDYDWLFSAGSYALRMSSLTNNLSLAMAIEQEDSGRVMLFPGDAEYGSWASWHTIDWGRRGTGGKHLTEDLLNRTVFYKVAHHLSHNGTARRLGLEMMTHKDLAAMATLDYSVISNGWKSTMPNKAIIRELLLRTKGRLMIMNEDELYYDVAEEVLLSDKIRESKNKMSQKEKKEFENAFMESERYLQYKVLLHKPSPTQK